MSSPNALVRARLGPPWIVLVVISASHAVIHAYSALMPWVYPVALVDLGFSVTALGLMVGATQLAGGFLQLGAGALARRLRRYTLVGMGVVLLGVASAATALASSFAQFFGASLMARVVTSTQHPLGNSLLADLYDRARRGAAIAAHVAGGNVGTLVLTPVAAVLVGLWGWRPAVLLLTLPVVLAGVAVLSLIREAPAPMATRSPMADLAAGLRVAGRSRNLVLIFAASMIGAGGRGLGVVILVVPLYLKRQLHVHEPLATELYTLMLLGSVVGPLVAGWLADRVGVRPVLVSGYALSVPFTLAILHVPAGPWLALVLLATGFIVYAESPLLQTALANEVPRAERDALFSLYFAVAFGVGALWSTGMGVILERLGYPTAFGCMAGSYVLAGLCVWGLKELRRLVPEPAVGVE